LESRLHAELFEHIGGERRLTEAGQKLLRHAETAESATLAALGEVAEDQQRVSGLVRLSVAEGFGSWVLAPSLSDFYDIYPGVSLDIVTTSGFLNPSKREADLAVMLARPQSGRLKVQKLGDYRLHLYARHDYLSKHGPLAHVSALKSHSLIGYVPEFIYSPELDYLNELGLGLIPNLRSTSINVQHRLIRSGAGIGVLPDFIGKQDAELIQLLPDQIEIIRHFWLVTHRDLVNLLRIKAVADWLRGRFTSI
jgi:DNA-binding transcriptional LysR family regulator